MNDRTYIEPIRQGLQLFLNKSREEEPAEWMDYMEVSLPRFIREHIDAGYTSIFEQTSRAYYDSVLRGLALNRAARNADLQQGQIYSHALKLYSEYLQSKFFPKPGLPMEPKVKAKAKAARKPAIPDEDPQTEGARKHMELERPYRNSNLRRKNIAYWGAQCQCCGMDFVSLYGEQLGRDYIEVHHLKPISSYDDEHDVDAVNDLVPLCANCHAMIHRGSEGPLTLGELRTQYRGQRWEISRKKQD